MRKKKLNNIFQMKDGTLYPILHSLESNGYLESYRNEIDGRKKKKVIRKNLDKDFFFGVL